MPLSKLLSLAGASLLLIGAGLGSAEAMPVAPVAAAPAGAEQVALHRQYPGSHRRYGRAHRNAPNRYCRNQPSRCR